MSLATPLVWEIYFRESRKHFTEIKESYSKYIDASKTIWAQGENFDPPNEKLQKLSQLMGNYETKLEPLKLKLFKTKS